MSPLKNSQGFIHLGIIGLVVLTTGLFAASFLASNPDLTFFNIGSQAATADRQACKGCDGTKEKRWDNKKRTCVLRESRKCGEEEIQRRKTQETKDSRTETSDVADCRFYNEEACGDKAIKGTNICQSSGKTKYCCPSGQKIVDERCQ